MDFTPELGDAVSPIPETTQFNMSGLGGAQSVTKNNFSQREKEKDYGYEQLTLLISKKF